MLSHEDFFRRRRGKAPDPAGPAPSPRRGAAMERSTPVTVALPRASPIPRLMARFRWRHRSCGPGFWPRRWRTALRVGAAIVAVAIVSWLSSRATTTHEPTWMGPILDSILARLQSPRMRNGNPRGRERVYIPVTERTRRQKVNATSRFLDELLGRQVDPPNKRPAAATPPEVRSILVAITSSKSRRQTGGSVSSNLLQQGCRPGWFCRRCLASHEWGSFRACDKVCSTCYAEALCGGDAPDDMWTVGGNVALQLQWEEGAVPASRYIPRIVHQEFHEPILSWQYPQLDRIQNSWRATGWQYRFYTPNVARTYVQQHYPAMVLQAYDMLSVPDRQSDLFRLLVLLREGGVYANIDLLLETNLDTLLKPNLGFAAAREDSLDGSRDHCLWNGIVASQPGHPFLVRAVERAVTGILDQWNEEDFASTVCASMDAPLWKTRAAPAMDNVCGSCALGFAVRQVLGESILGRFRLGLAHQVGRGIGESLIFTMSLDDTGAYRCSDIQQNILVASTAQSGLTKASIQRHDQRSWLRLRRS